MAQKVKIRQNGINEFQMFIDDQEMTNVLAYTLTEATDAPTTLEVKIAVLDKVDVQINEKSV